MKFTDGYLLGAGTVTLIAGSFIAGSVATAVVLSRAVKADPEMKRTIAKRVAEGAIDAMVGNEK